MMDLTAFALLIYGALIVTSVVSVTLYIGELEKKWQKENSQKIEKNEDYSISELIDFTGRPFILVGCTLRHASQWDIGISLSRGTSKVAEQYRIVSVSPLNQYTLSLTVEPLTKDPTKLL